MLCFVDGVLQDLVGSLGQDMLAEPVVNPHVRSARCNQSIWTKIRVSGLS